MQDSYRQIWESIAEAIKTQVNIDTYQRWFANITLMRADEQEMTLRVPNNIYQLWIESNYMPLLQTAVMNVLGAPRQVKFVFGTGDAVAAAATPQLPPPRMPRWWVTLARGSPRPLTKRPRVARVRRRDDRHPARDARQFGALGMNPRNTFETFVVGQNNHYAHAASKAVADTPAKTYNPLFLYGGVGLGKTHLMQSIGQAMLTKKKNLKVIYISSERFTNEFIDAIQHSTLVKFRKKYRLADVLLIDDIQFLSGKERSQEEFFPHVQRVVRRP